MSFFNRRKDIYMSNPETGLPNVFNINDLEEDIKGIVEQLPPTRYAPPQVREEPAAASPEAGRLSAEVIAAHHEAAAKAVEMLGKELMACMGKIDRLTVQAAEAFEFIRETAEDYRKDGKLVSERIERSAAIIQEVRETCEALRGKIAS